jgi:hypothetical protein
MALNSEQTDFTQVNCSLARYKIENTDLLRDQLKWLHGYGRKIPLHSKITDYANEFPPNKRPKFDQSPANICVDFNRAMKQVK